LLLEAAPAAWRPQQSTDILPAGRSAPIPRPLLLLSIDGTDRRTGNIRRILVRGVSAPLPTEAKKIMKI